LLILNGGEGDCRFVLPQVKEEGFWMTLLDSAHSERERHGPPDGTSVMVAAHSLVLVRHGTERRFSATPPEPEASVPTADAGA
jgi:hypothetical protein